MERLHELIESVSSQFSHCLDQLSNFAKSRLSTLSDPVYSSDKLLEHLLYAKMLDLIFACWHWLKDKVTAKFKSHWIVDIPRRRKMIAFSRKEQINRKHRSILFKDGVMPYLWYRYSENRATTKSNYADFEASIEAVIEAGEVSKWYKFKMLMQYLRVNPFQNFIFVIDMPLARCIANYIKARFF
jgi:hypothetical protein